jgi:hypothetical protein
VRSSEEAEASARAAADELKADGFATRATKIICRTKFRRSSLGFYGGREYEIPKACALLRIKAGVNFRVCLYLQRGWCGRLVRWGETDSGHGVKHW